MKWGIDVSVYQDLKPEKWTELRTNGLAFVLIKACQGTSFTDRMLEDHIGHCKDNGISFGFYQWVDPLQSPTQQADYFLTLIRKYQPACVAGDFEQWWGDWDAWHKKVVQHLDVPIPVMAAGILYNQYKAYTDYLTSQLNIPFIAYSAAWFIDAYVPQMTEWVKTLPHYWNAGYIKWVDPNSDRLCSWPEFQQLLGTLGNPILPKNLDNWTIWQFTSHLPLQGFPNLDLNIIRDEVAYQTLFGIPPAPMTHYRVTAAALNVRESPSMMANVIGCLSGDQVIEKLNVSEDGYWYEIVRADGLKGWSARKYLVAVAAVG